MHNLNLFKTLLGMPAEARFEGKMREMEPDEQSFCFWKRAMLWNILSWSLTKRRL